jgi:uncharacterized protein YndB with AHSA1/START domain
MKIPLRLLVLFGTALASVSCSAAERSIENQILVPAGIDPVWEAWTTPAGLKSFFAPDANVELRVDGPFELFINPLDEPGRKGADGMRILAIQEKKMLAFTWNAPPSLPEARQQRTHVVVRFEVKDANTTLVTLHHDGWGDGGEWDKAFNYFTAAWPNVLGNLKKRFETGPIDWTEWMASLRKYMAAEAAKKAKAATEPAVKQ